MFLYVGVQNYVLWFSVIFACAIVVGLSFYCYRRRSSRIPDEVDDSAGDPLAPKPFQGMKMPKPKVQDSVRMSMFNGSITSNSYDRNHITGENIIGSLRIKWFGKKQFNFFCVVQVPLARPHRTECAAERMFIQPRH